MYEPPASIPAFDGPVLTVLVNGFAMLAANQTAAYLGEGPPYTDDAIRANLSDLIEMHEEEADHE